MNQVVSHQPVTVQAHVHSQVSPSEICGGRNGTGTGFPRFPPLSIIPPMLHMHSFIHLSLILYSLSS